MYRISKKFRFDAAHRLDGLPMGHKCGRMHGHTYEVEVVLESAALDEVGFVRDYGDLASFKKWLDDTFDHRLINETVPQPTAENMAHLIYNRAVSMYPEVTAVRVSETDNTTAWYAPHNLPPIDTILDVIESLAAEPSTNPDRQRLRSALLSLDLGYVPFRGGGGAGGNAYAGGNGSSAIGGAGGGGGGGAAYGPGARGGNGGPGGSFYGRRGGIED